MNEFQQNWVTMALVMGIYLFPAIVAYLRGHASRHGILILNFVFGFTVIGWFIALIWAVSNRGAVQNVTIIGGNVHDHTSNR